MPEKAIVQDRLLLEQLIQNKRQKGLLNSGSLLCALWLKLKYLYWWVNHNVLNLFHNCYHKKERQRKNENEGEISRKNSEAEKLRSHTYRKN